MYRPLSLSLSIYIHIYIYMYMYIRIYGGQPHPPAHRGLLPLQLRGRQQALAAVRPGGAPLRVHDAQELPRAHQALHAGSAAEGGRPPEQGGQALRRPREAAADAGAGGTARGGAEGEGRGGPGQGGEGGRLRRGGQPREGEGELGGRKGQHRGGEVQADLGAGHGQEAGVHQGAGGGGAPGEPGRGRAGRPGQEGIRRAEEPRAPPSWRRHRLRGRPRA